MFQVGSQKAEVSVSDLSHMQGKRHWFALPCEKYVLFSNQVGCLELAHQACMHASTCDCCALWLCPWCCASVPVLFLFVSPVADESVCGTVLSNSYSARMVITIAYAADRLMQHPAVELKQAAAVQMVSWLSRCAAVIICCMHDADFGLCGFWLHCSRRSPCST
jgi:hypothetical protein